MEKRGYSFIAGRRGAVPYRDKKIMSKCRGGVSPPEKTSRHPPEYHPPLYQGSSV